MPGSSPPIPVPSAPKIFSPPSFTASTSARNLSSRSNTTGIPLPSTSSAACSSRTPMNLSGNQLSSIGLSGQGKSTSLEARRLLEANQRIGQTEKGQIAPGELVPPNDEPPIAIKPGVQPFHHPAPRTIARLPQGFLGQLLSCRRIAVIAVPPIGAHMLGIAARLHLAQRALVVIASV